MANIEVKEFKIKISDKEYTFRLDFRALIKYSDRYDNGLEIFNNFLSNKNTYGCIVKVLSCACDEKDFSEDELALLLPFDFRTMKILDGITMALIQGVMDEKKSTGTEQGKNE